MSNTVISVENVSKVYRLGQIGCGTLKGDVSRWWAKLRGQPDPFLKIGDEHHARKIGEQFWALDDVSFQIKEGEVVGIIGRNGSGKSTLLKILSQVTTPTSGQIKIKGRIASLLEVGTGFNPEMTGRENVFLNGTILGMTKTEIRSRFDEIVAFSEIEEFIDTPVKRYSSGMYVRLAFAVAAHLEPEILIVDEVLAVGDAGFQKKCLGKMGDVASKGRTVLFVSHTMTAVKSLTSRAILMNGGRVVCDTDTEDAIQKYLEMFSDEDKKTFVVKSKGKHTDITAVNLLDASGKKTDFYTSGTVFQIEVHFTTDGTRNFSIEIFLNDPNQTRLAIASLYQLGGVTLPDKPGKYVCKLQLQPLLLASGSYNLDVVTSKINTCWDHQVDKALTFEVPLSDPNANRWQLRYSDGYGAFAWPAKEASGIEFSSVS